MPVDMGRCERHRCHPVASRSSIDRDLLHTARPDRDADLCLDCHVLLACREAAIAGPPPVSSSGRLISVVVAGMTEAELAHARGEGTALCAAPLRRSRGRAAAECARCRQTRPVEARGFCRPCYAADRRERLRAGSAVTVP